MIQSGRYRDHSFQYVMANDKDYCGWVVQALHEKRALPQDLQQFAELIKKQEGGVLRLGAYKNWFFRDVWRRDQGYCRWAASLQQPGPGMERFSGYAARKLGVEWSMPPKRPGRSVRKDVAPPTHRNDELRKKPERDHKRARAEKETNLCIICLAAPRQLAFAPRGHLVACLRCGSELINERAHRRCPICRKDIRSTLRIFAV